MVGRRRMGPRSHAWSWCRTALLFSVLGTPVVGQGVAATQEKGALWGLVVDATSGSKIAGAMITIALDDGEETTLTGAGGAFAFGEVPVGAQLLMVRQYGYSPLAVTAVVSVGPPDLLEIPLAPSPFALEGLTVVADNLATMKQRLQSRRRAAPFMTRAYDQERLWRTAARDMTEFLGFEASLWPSSCGSGTCIVRRGRLYPPRVYIDEVVAFGGLDELETYRPQDFYLLEVYSSGGEIRAYTHQFMERMVRRPMALIPIGLWP